MNAQTKHQLIKHSSVIAITNSITLLQRKLWNFLVANSFNVLKEKDEFTISISELMSWIWFSSHNSDYLKQSLKKLVSTVVEFNILWKDKNSWEATALLSSVKISKWVCTYSFSSILKKKLQTPNIYAKLNLEMISRFNSKYTLALYELLCDYNNIGQTPVIELNDYKRLMWADSRGYDVFKKLSSCVLAPSIKELNSVTEFNVDVIYSKEWRKVIALKFKFDKVMNSNANKNGRNIKAKDTSMLTLLTNKYELTTNQAKFVLHKYPLPYLKESLAIVDVKRKQWVIKIIPAYLLSVLLYDYVPVKIVNRNMNEENFIVPKIKKQKSNIKSLDEIFAWISNEERKTFIQKFEKEFITTDVYRRLYEKCGLDSPLFRVKIEWFVKNIL